MQQLELTVSPMNARNSTDETQKDVHVDTVLSKPIIERSGPQIPLIMAPTSPSNNCDERGAAMDESEAVVSMAIALSSETHERRKAVQNQTRPLKHWLQANGNHPYPTKQEKTRLAASACLSLTQVSNWFANARRRMKTTLAQPSDGDCWDAHGAPLDASFSAVCIMESAMRRHLDTAPAAAELRFSDSRDCRAAACIIDTAPAVPTLPARKYKQCMLARYLEDAVRYCHNVDYAEGVIATSSLQRCKRRLLSGSEGESSEGGLSSPSPTLPDKSASDELKELQALICQQDMHMASSQEAEDVRSLKVKELSAVVALTTMARAGL